MKATTTELNSSHVPMLSQPEGSPRSPASSLDKPPQGAPTGSERHLARRSVSPFQPFRVRGIKVLTATRNEDQVMYSRVFGIHGMISAFVAIALFAITAIVFDRAYLFSAPVGVVQVEQPTPIVALDEVAVIAKH